MITTYNDKNNELNDNFCYILPVYYLPDNIIIWEVKKAKKVLFSSTILLTCILTRMILRWRSIRCTLSILRWVRIAIVSISIRKSSSRCQGDGTLIVSLTTIRRWIRLLKKQRLIFKTIIYMRQLLLPFHKADFHEGNC